jgi:hypothetical protein
VITGTAFTSAPSRTSAAIRVENPMARKIITKTANSFLFIFFSFLTSLSKNLRIISKKNKMIYLITGNRFFSTILSLLFGETRQSEEKRAIHVGLGSAERPRRRAR